jgi:hypothetical protein
MSGERTIMWSKEIFLPELKKFDPLLRLRRAWAGDKWIIERRARRETKCIPVPDSIGDRDTWIAAKDGYVFVMSFPYNMLGSWVFQELKDRDSWRFKTPDAHADAIEQEEEREEVCKDRTMHNLLDDCHDESYDFLHWRQGERVSLNGHGLE